MKSIFLKVTSLIGILISIIMILGWIFLIKESKHIFEKGVYGFPLLILFISLYLTSIHFENQEKQIKLLKEYNKHINSNEDH